MADDTNSTIATVRTGSIGNDLSNNESDDRTASGLSGREDTASDQTRREQDQKLKAAFLAMSAPSRRKRPANLGEALRDTQPQPRKQPSNLGEALRVIQPQPGRIKNLGQALRHAGKGDESDESTAASWNEAAVLSINTAGGTPLAQQDPTVPSRAIGKFSESGLKDLSEEERAAIDKYVESLAE